jgi:catechol 2,3-dioxygenase-like lactoylglutathione lyase family enzyme
VSLEAVAFLGMRIADPDVYAATVALYRDTLGLRVTSVHGRHSTRFVLGDGTALHVYGPDDEDHLDFGERMCVGYRVADVAATLTRLRAAGIDLLDDPPQSDGEEAWSHIRTPDGAVHEILGPDPDAAIA